MNANPLRERIRRKTPIAFPLRVSKRHLALEMQPRSGTLLLEHHLQSASTDCAERPHAWADNSPGGFGLDSSLATVRRGSAWAWRCSSLDGHDRTPHSDLLKKVISRVLGVRQLACDARRWGAVDARRSGADPGVDVVSSGRGGSGFHFVSCWG